MPDTHAPAAVRRPSTMPTGLNHLVLNVRDIEESHRFWTEIVGLEQVGALTPRPERPDPPKMRFYSVDHGNGKRSHHDVALLEVPGLPAPEEEAPCAIAHVAIAYPTREAWLERIAWVQACGVKFGRRIEHGMTHSLYIRDPNGYGVELLYELPRAMWEGDIDAALNYIRSLPTEGPAALEDNPAESPVFGAKR